MPALIKAEQALKELKKEHITEVKAYKSPSNDIKTVMFAVMVLLQKEPNWSIV